MTVQGKKRIMPKGNRGRGKIDMPLFITLLVMIAFGLIMIFSASSPSSYYEEGNIFFYIKKQIIWTAVGFLAMFAADRFGYKMVKKYAGVICVGCFILMLLVVLIGKTGGGAQRWLAIGPITIQPSELSKFGLIFFFAKLLSERPKNHLDDFWKGFLPYIGIILLFVGCLYLQDHMSGAVIIFLTMMIILVVGGAKLSHMGIIGLCGVAGFALFAISDPYRIERILAYGDPFADKMDSGWQIVQGLYAIGSGGLFGRGLGQSRQKFLYIPEAHNDYIYAIICEELGFIGALLVATLFVFFVTRGITIALRAPDKFSSITAFGITALIGFQYLINVGVVTAVLPNTGMQLPFFSAGGSSLVIMMCAMGVLLNISRYMKKSNGKGGEL